MANNPEQSAPTAPPAPNYEQRIAQQQALVKDLEEQNQKKPSPELQLDLSRKTDTLRHIQNLAKGSPQERARKAAETAKLSALSKAVSMPE